MAELYLKRFLKHNGIDKAIEKLQHERKMLKNTINDEIRNELKREFRDKNLEDVMSTYVNDIGSLYDSLYEKYRKELDHRISRLQYISNEI